jgi:hypothetical protein
MTSDVSIFARVVAAGLAPGNNRVRLTVSLMPGKPGNGAQFDISRWPQAVNEFLLHSKPAAFGVVVEKIPVTPARPQAPSRPLDPLDIQYGFADLDIAGVQALWKKIGEAAAAGTAPVQTSDAFWNDVAAVFANDTLDADAKPPLYMDTSGPDAVPIVLPTGRGDAAILHLMHHATRLASRLNGTAIAVPAGTPGDSALDPWSKEVGKKEGTEKGKLQEALDAARKKENDAIEAAAQKYHDTNREFLKTLKPSSGASVPEVKQLKDVPPTLVGRPVRDLFDEGKFDSLLEQPRNLHLAALLDDVGPRPEDLPRSRMKAPKDEPEPLPDEPVGHPPSYVARQFISAIRTSPMLARLFHFVVDVECTLPLAETDYTAPAKEEAFAFLFLGAGEISGLKVNSDGLFFSLAKATLSSKKLNAFWPATREEVDMRCAGATMEAIRQTGLVSQVDGVVDLGQTISEPGNKEYNPRFDIISIDPAFAMETSERNRQKQASVEDALKRTGLAKSEARSALQGEPETGTASRGLSIVDRWRALGVAEEVMTTQAARKDKLRILDADDLTTGYRVDVAVRTGDPANSAWRSLMEREIDYQRFKVPGPDLFQKWFRSLGLDRPPRRKSAPELVYGADRRRDYDAGFIVTTSRRRLRSKDQMIHAEEMIAAWEGNPLGLNCGQETILVREGSDVAINRTYYLPNSDKEELHKAWPLRYGWAYRFGIRPVWMGGASLSLADAAARYDSKTDGLRNLALPRSAASVEGWTRFLRYERTLSPVVLLPKAVAEEPLDLMPQSGVRAILRTIQVGDICKECAKQGAQCLCEYSDRKTESTWRVILPPQVSLDEAVRHGVFDRGNIIGEVAPGDLLAVDYDKPIGDRAIGRINPLEDEGLGRTNGFPAVKRTTPTSPDSKPAFEDYFSVHDRPKKVKERSGAEHQYYADPMAEYLVVALRPNNQRPGEGYFDGQAKIIRVRDKDGQILPVALNIERETTKTRGPKPKQQDFWNKEIKLQKINGQKADGTATGGTVQAKVGTIRLRAGEAIAVDCWFIPSVEALRAYFGWPEALAIKAVAVIDNPPSDRSKFRELLISKLPTTLDDTGGRVALASQEFLKRYEREPAWVGIAGLVADPAVIAAAAAILHRHLQYHPIPEIAAIRTIDVVHAVAKPPRAPQFLEGKDLVVLRSPNNVDGRLKVLGDYLSGQGAGPYGLQGDDGILFAGKVAMDRNVCRQLEVVAHCTSPARGALDDIRLGRTELQRLLGEWPNRVVPENGDADGSPVDSQKVRLTRRARHLFGFDVDEEGTVYLPKQEVTLLQLDDLAERADDSNFADLETIDLLTEQISSLTRTKSRDERRPDAASLAKGAVRATPLDAYTDRHARKIVVSLRGTSRFDPYFIRLNPRAAVRLKDKDFGQRPPLPETMFPPIPEQVELIRARSYDGEFPSVDDQNSRYLEEAAEQKLQVRVMWIPATIAPAKPQVHTVLPSYFIVRPPEKGTSPPGETTQPKTSGAGKPASGSSNEKYWFFNRKPSVRLLLDRPWYSSGEGERLGVILWPPQLREIGTEPADEAQLQRGEILRFVLHKNSRRSEADSKSSLMLLHDFQDEDLGSGGKFTTRWGADPIRQNSGPMGPFLRPAALLDLIDDRDPAPKDNSVGYVPSVTIPLRDLREEEEKQLKDGGPKEPITAYETITAALATYVPRFDVESEKWFVDLALNSDRVVEPFVRFGLVRYQAEAQERLRASAPITAWAQVLPERTVQVWLSKAAEDPDTQVTIQVSGNISGRLAGDAGDGGMVYPRFRISVIEAAEVASGVNIERTAVARLMLKDQNAVEEKAVGPTPELVPAVAWTSASAPDRKGMRDSPLTWRTTFFLPVKTDEEGRPKKRKLAVLVEEIEDYRSTANDDASLVVAPDPAETAAQPAAAPPRNAQPDLVTAPVAKSIPGANPKPQIPRPVPLQALDAVFDLDPIAGDEVSSGVSRTGPRFLARINIDYDETIVPEVSRYKSLGR